MIRTLLIIAISFLFGSCHRQVKPMELQQTDSISAITTVKIKNSEQPKLTKSELAQKLDSLGFINIAEADSTILIDLIYTRSDNFTGEVLYETLREAYLHQRGYSSMSSGIDDHKL